jgi:hypothetical protein
MTHNKLMEDLLKAGFKTGWVVRDGKIILWENADPIPTEFEQYAELELAAE